MSEEEDEEGLDQDALAAAWGASLDGEETEEQDDEIAAQWAAMIHNSDEPDEDDAAANRVLGQTEIDAMLGFAMDEARLDDVDGIQAIVNSAVVSYERLPLLEIVFDRLVRLMTSSLRNYTSDVVEVSLDSTTSVRFGDYLDSIPLPAILSVFRITEWGSYGIVTVESNLVYSVIDVLLGGGRSGPIRVEGRPYTTIETSLIRRMIEIVLKDVEQAFSPITSVHMEIDRLETNPRFATITQPANAAILVEFRVDMEDRGGKIQLLLPYSTIEPIRELLMQMFMGEKFGRDATWEGHLAREILNAQVDVDAVLFEGLMPLGRVKNLQVGDVLPLGIRPEHSVELRCGGTELCSGLMGKKEDNIALRVDSPLRPPRVNLAALEQAEDAR